MFIDMFLCQTHPCWIIIHWTIIHNYLYIQKYLYRREMIILVGYNIKESLFSLRQATPTFLNWLQGNVDYKISNVFEHINTLQ